ncbi:hypothetical protein [Vibrio breoganii]|uniref:hypothetical protein n=1 Tax=Vibrio breoganii TaxID=553239 RepID=UPI000C83CEF6|nr:hypothetical protein [Vibrio breoganii]PMG89966.1 hypothetical protein BCU79_18220 [Vibrio breoganii]PMJ48020.1 hypothetical protein BCU21_04910 [Vibrio breoganii]PMK57706.1 hypothetical protein BCT97_09955 [Vibrio breoganii]PMM79570.1 hypothetical protein BCT44_15015 [Vibrio breoganii]PMO27170.1 hypothetical protein BCT14_13465 [Vibrio breoganii]
MAQNKNSLSNLRKHSTQARKSGELAFKLRIECLERIVADRKANYIPTGDLPSNAKDFYSKNDWIPDTEEREAISLTRNVFYASYNAQLRDDLKVVFEDIKTPLKTKKIVDEQELKIARLENQVKNLASENLNIENEYRRLVVSLNNKIKILETNNRRLTDLLENNSEVIQFPQR